MTAQNPIIDYQTRWDGGISDLSKNAPEIEYGFGRSVNYRTDPFRLTILPKTVKESGSIVTDLVKDGDRIGTDLYEYGDTGNIYKRTSAGSVTLLRTVANSHGNGMKYYGEDDRLYYTSDKVIGRYGQIGGTPAFADDFLGAEGGIPQNTYWLDLEASSSQYADRADTASLSITGDFCIEAWIKPESLPTVGNSMVVFSKWDVNGNARSYKFEIYAISGYFGDGSDGALTISSDTTEAPIDSACTGTSGTYSLSATNASFATNQIILIHQTRGTGAGTQQRNKIVSYTAGTITLETALNADYVSGAQVRVLPQYTNVTINSAKTYTAKAWNGTVGGILAFLANGTVTVTGTISASGKGFRGGNGTSSNNRSYSGEGTAGASVSQQVANGNGGGGGGTNDAGGGGGSNGTQGEDGQGYFNTVGGYKGDTSGTADLTTMNFGGAGGGGAEGNASPYIGGNGGNGGGIIFISGVTITISGAVVSDGTQGTIGTSPGTDTVPGGSGAGGSILLKAQTATLGTGLITASGAARLVGGSGEPYHGGAGGNGRVHLDYYTSYTGTTTPTLDVSLDNSLVTTTTYQLRVGISTDGTAEEFLAKAASLSAAQTNHIAVSWDASDHEAEFMLDGVSLGTSIGAATSINNNASKAAIGADFNNAARNFFDGKIDEVRVWNTERTAAQIYSNRDVYVATTSAGLVAWWKLNNGYTDAHANANDLTGQNTPTFATDVPFSAATTRNDLDQELNTSGNTYTTPVAIDEGATHRQTFVPQKDPQKSVEVLVAAIGTGNWTVTVHDPQNRVVATKTITNANMHTGDMEFVFDSVWRPVRGATYHFHVTSTVNDGTVTTTTASDLETVDFHTYYQFLVEDTEFHPIEQILNVLAIANERYVATYGADTGYDPHRLVLPSGWRVRCFALWRGFIAIGCTRGSSVTSTDEGMIFFWDGKSTTYNDFVPIPEGAINAMKAYKGRLCIVAGYHGEILFYEGGDSTNDDIKQQIPKIGDAEYIEVMPKAMTVYDGLLRIGVAGTSNAASVERGVYTYGKRLSISPISFSYDYPISTGSRASTNVKVGFLYPIATQLIIGWKDNTAYGTDVVSPTAAPFATATVERTIKDFGRVSKEKKAMLVRAEFDALNAGETMRVKYRFDRSDTWILGDIITTTGETEARLSINQGKHRELEIAADMATSVSTSPGLLELGVQEDLKPTELRY